MNGAMIKRCPCILHNFSVALWYLWSMKVRYNVFLLMKEKSKKSPKNPYQNKSYVMGIFHFDEPFSSHCSLLISILWFPYFFISSWIWVSKARLFSGKDKELEHEACMKMSLIYFCKPCKSHLFQCLPVFCRIL